MNHEDAHAGSGRSERVGDEIKEVNRGRQRLTALLKTEQCLLIFEDALEAKESELVRGELATRYGSALRSIVIDLSNLLNDHLGAIRVHAIHLVREGSSEAAEVLKLGIATDNLRDRIPKTSVEGAREQILASIRGREYDLPMALTLLEKESARIHLFPDVREPSYVESQIYKSEGKMVRELLRGCLNLFLESPTIPIRETPPVGTPFILENVSHSLTSLTTELSEIAKEAKTASNPAEIRRGIAAVRTLIATATPIKDFFEPGLLSGEIAETYHRQKLAQHLSLERELFVKIAGRECAFASYHPRPDVTIPTSLAEGLGSAERAIVGVRGSSLECHFHGAGTSLDGISAKQIFGSAYVGLRKEVYWLDAAISVLQGRCRVLFEPTGRGMLFCPNRSTNFVQVASCNEKSIDLHKPRDLDSPSGFSISPDNTKAILRDWQRLAVLLADGTQGAMGGVYPAATAEGQLSSAVFFGNDHIISLVSESRANTHTHIECLALDGRFTKQWLAKLPFDVRTNPAGFVASAEGGTLAFLPTKESSTIWMADATTQDNGLGTFSEYQIPIDGILQTTVTPDLTMAVVRTKDEIYVLDLMALKDRDPANVIAIIPTLADDREVVFISDDGASIVVTPFEKESATRTRIFNLISLRSRYIAEKGRATGTLLPGGPHAPQ